MQTTHPIKSMQATRKQIASVLKGQSRSIQIGRSYNTASFGSNTPIIELEGNDAPKLCGHPYLKTEFKRKGFSKILYTPSTLHVIVGKDWKP